MTANNLFLFTGQLDFGTQGTWVNLVCNHGLCSGIITMAFSGVGKIVPSIVVTQDTDDMACLGPQISETWWLDSCARYQKSSQMCVISMPDSKISILDHLGWSGIALGCLRTLRIVIVQNSPKIVQNGKSANKTCTFVQELRFRLIYRMFGMRHGHSGISSFP